MKIICRGEPSPNSANVMLRYIDAGTGIGYGRHCASEPSTIYTALFMIIGMARQLAMPRAIIYHWQDMAKAEYQNLTCLDQK